MIRAFNILTGELDPSKEKGYCPALYEGLKYCSSPENSGDSKHIHVSNNKQFIATLISKGIIKNPISIT